MTAQHDLPTQIACARRAFDQAPSPVMQSIISTLEWLSANEPKIKAKVETADHVVVLPATASTKTYKAANAVFLDMAKGGWERRYEIVDEVGNLIGTKIEGCETRSSKPYAEFVPFGYRTFATRGSLYRGL
jgi:hypothetical protein